jgi:hypothetical protein
LARARAAPRDDGDASPVGAQPDELEDLVAAGGDDAPGAAHDRRLEVQALRRAGIGGTLVTALDRAERVERLHDRDSQRLGGAQGRVGGHPEVGVDDVGPLALPLLAQLRREGVHVRQQLVLGVRLGGAGLDVVDLGAAGERHAPRRGGVVAPGVDDDADAARAEALGQGGHVDVLAAGVLAAEDGQRACVLRNHGHSHPTTSSSRSSQSSRNRWRP